MITAPRLAEGLTTPIPCRCDPEKIGAVQAYLYQHFPDYVLRDFHAPSRLEQAGLPGPHADHHVISLSHDDVLPYYAVLLSEFQEHYSAAQVGECLRRWDLAGVLHANRIVFVSQDGASAL
ncbi:MAG: hypothetical protein ACHQ4J_03190 [Candidatus Binatia bacterium]